MKLKLIVSSMIMSACLSQIMINQAVAAPKVEKTSHLVKDSDGYIDISADIKRYNRISNLIQDKIKVKPNKILENTKADMYEIVLPNDQIIYVSKNEKFLIDGALVNFDNMKENVISARSEKLISSTVFNEKLLNYEDAIKVVKGDGSRKLITFEDPNCGYCKKFHTEKEALTNVTIYTFIVPILGPDSLAKAKNIWCSPDRLKTWNNYMTNQKVEQAPTCDASAIDRNIELVKKNKIRGTPTSFYNGKRIVGALPVKEFEERMNQK